VVFPLAPDPIRPFLCLAHPRKLTQSVLRVWQYSPLTPTLPPLLGSWSVYPHQVLLEGLDPGASPLLRSLSLEYPEVPSPGMAQGPCREAPLEKRPFAPPKALSVHGMSSHGARSQDHQLWGPQVLSLSSIPRTQFSSEPA
jgi:hypothetical protein